MSLLPGAAVGQDASDEEAPWASRQRDAAVATVLATDPRFTDLPDAEVLRREASATFDLGQLLAASHYRVLGGPVSDFADAGILGLRTRASHLVEVMLVDGCREGAFTGVDGPVADPCAWRHRWVFRVQPDGGLTLLFEEGDPDIPA
jgi:hypothetical protein